MFWKKSNNIDDSSDKLFSMPKEGRGSFRVNPPLNAPLKAILNNKPISIINISSGGFQCKNNDLEVGRGYSIEIVLPPENTKISCSAEILENSDESNCRCRFLGLSLDFENQIHRYVLNLQKNKQKYNKRQI